MMELEEPTATGGGSGGRLTPEERAARYKPGSIKRIRLKNFLTYADVEFCPGPRLNVVIGPNGTGKSTILCAICLGLGGEPPLLGRADDARTFIMHEKDQAIIEIEMAPTRDAQGNPGPKNIIKRVIDRNKGTERGRGKGASQFYINSDTVNKKEVLKLVQETYQLQIDNMCTFLPQDKVGSFSGFDSKQLLIETEKSLSASKHLFTTHERLIEMERDMRTSTGSVETIGDKLQKLEDEMQSLELQKEKMEERREAEQQIDLLETKQVWLRFDEKREEATKLKAERSQAKKEWQNASKSVEPLKEELRTVNVEVAQLDDNRKRLTAAQKMAKRKQTKHMDKVVEIDEGMDSLMADLSQIDANARNHQRKIQQAEARVQDAKDQLDALDSEESIDKEYAAASNESKHVRQELTKAKNEHSRAHTQHKDLHTAVTKKERKLEQLNNEQEQRRARIFHGLPNLGKSYEWIEQNRRHFRHPILGPIVTEITDVDDPEAAAILEQHVPTATLKSYIVQCKEDYNHLYREIRTNRGIPINIMIVDRVTEPTRIYSDRKMAALKRDHGIIKWLDEVVSAPPLVMQALRDSSKMHNVVVGNERTERSMSESSDLQKLLCQREDGSVKGGCVVTRQTNGLMKYTMSTSRYSGKVGLKTDGIFGAKMLKKGVDPTEVAELEREIDDLRSQIQKVVPRVKEAQQRVAEVESEGQDIVRRRDIAKAAKQNFKNAQNRVRTAKQKLQREIDSTPQDTAREKREIVKKIMGMIKSEISTLDGAGKQHDEVMKTTYRLCGVKMNDSGIVEKKRLLQETINEKEAESQALEGNFNRISEEFSAAKAEAHQLKAEAEQHGQMTEELKARLETLPAKLDEVDALLADALEKVHAIEDNPEVLRRYEERVKQIKETREELENLEEAKDVKQQQLQSDATPWADALKNTLTQKVNTLFGKYMAELGCAGEVHLTRGNLEEGALGDFANWGVEIRVKFREKSPLQVLSAHHHSGGERSVSTIMYLMALQDLMVSPFRCVDEINQGLDERNERLVFKRIVENSTRLPKNANLPHTHIGQYFLITPKLLPNLTDMENDDVNILCIFNGPFNFHNYSDWNVDKFLAARKRIRAGEDDEAGDSDDEDGYARTSGSRALSGDEEDDVDADDDVPSKRSKKKKKRRKEE